MSSYRRKNRNKTEVASGIKARGAIPSGSCGDELKRQWLAVVEAKGTQVLELAGVTKENS